MGQIPSLRYNRKYGVTKEQLLSDISKCDQFAWSWLEDTKGVHHTGIVFYLDDEPRYTAHWTLKDGSKLVSCLVESEGQLVFEDERKREEHDPGRFDFKEPLQAFSLGCINALPRDSNPRRYYDAVLTKLTRFRFWKYDNESEDGDHPKFYDLGCCNCRDHVEAVVCDVLYDDPRLPNIINKVHDVRRSWPLEGYMYSFLAYISTWANALASPRFFINPTMRIQRVYKWQRPNQKMMAQWRGPYMGFQVHQRRMDALLSVVSPYISRDLPLFDYITPPHSALKAFHYDLVTDTILEEYLWECEEILPSWRASVAFSCIFLPYFIIGSQSGDTSKTWSLMKHLIFAGISVWFGASLNGIKNVEDFFRKESDLAKKDQRLINWKVTILSALPLLYAYCSRIQLTTGATIIRNTLMVLGMSKWIEEFTREMWKLEDFNSIKSELRRDFTYRYRSLLTYGGYYAWRAERSSRLLF